MTAQFQSQVTVEIDGEPLGIFKSRTGGATKAGSSKYRPGGMQKQRTRFGQTDTDDVTVVREHEQERDTDLVVRLRPKVGVASMTVTDQPLDRDGAPFGKPTVYVGTLMSVDDGNSDAESEDGRELTLVQQVLEVV